MVMRGITGIRISHKVSPSQVNSTLKKHRREFGLSTQLGQSQSWVPRLGPNGGSQDWDLR
jgi:hypothetical protein